MTTYNITTDAIQTTIEAASADEAACKFAASEKLYDGCETARAVEARAENLGGWAIIEEATTPKTLTVELKHRSSIPGARWCEPIGWQPANEIEDAEYLDGSWWSTVCEEQEAGLVYFGEGDEGDEGDEIDVSLDDLRIAACGNCRVIGTVEL